MNTLEVLNRIASGENIYGFVCAHGSEVVRAASEGAEAIRKVNKVNKLLKCWEEDGNENENVKKRVQGINQAVQG